MKMMKTTSLSKVREMLAFSFDQRRP